MSHAHTYKHYKTGLLSQPIYTQMG